MVVPYTLTCLFWLAVATLCVGLWKRWQLWSVGRPTPVAWRSLKDIPSRYFGDVHHVVSRDPYIAKTHIAVAGGAVAAIVLVALNYGLALYTRVLDGAIVVATLVMLTGATMAWWRRREKPARLSGGSWDRLPLTLAAFAVGLAILGYTSPAATSAVISFAGLGLIVIGGSELALGIGLGGPMKHAIAGALHLAFHPRPERFGGGRSTALQPLALEQGEFGVKSPADFKWNQLLGFDACVQCGKCEAACPAFAAGQPLNPKKLIQDLVAGFTATSDADYAGRLYPGKPRTHHVGDPRQAIVPNLIGDETLWSCTTCRACVEECPMMIEHVDAIVGLRRHQNLTEGDAPGKAAQTLAFLRETGTSGNHAPQKRYAWALDLGVKIADPGKPIDVLLMAGEGAFDDRYQRTLRALIKVLKTANVDFAVPGEREVECGDIARRLGDEATFQRLAQQTIAMLGGLNFKRIVTPDPHLFHALKNEYPALGGDFHVLHHTAFLAELIAQKRLTLTSAGSLPPITYHDPCYLGRYNGEFEAPRSVLRSIGFTVSEMQRSGPRSRCCGGGGGAPLTDIPGERRIPDMRMEDVNATGAKIVAVSCPQCTAMLEGVTGHQPQVRDIAELVAERLEAAP